MNKTQLPIQKNLLVRSATLALSCLLLASCAEDNAKYSYADEKDNNLVIKMNSFDVKGLAKDDNTSDYIVVSITRNIDEIRDGELTNISRPLYKNTINKPVSNNENLAENNRYFIGDGFTRILTSDEHPAQSYDVTSIDSYQEKWVDSNSDKTVNTIVYKYIPVTIEGVITQEHNVVGVHKNLVKTTLNTLAKAKSAPYAFPVGSRCYVINKNISKAYFQFSEQDLIEAKTSAKKAQIIKEWQQKYKNHVQAKYGTDNNINAFYAVIDDLDNTLDNNADNSITEKTYQSSALVEYENKLYAATYQQAADIQPNHQREKGQVNCTTYNTVAADFMQKLIQHAY